MPPATRNRDRTRSSSHDDDDDDEEEEEEVAEEEAEEAETVWKGRWNVEPALAVVVMPSVSVSGDESLGFQRVRVLTVTVLCRMPCIKSNDSHTLGAADHRRVVTPVVAHVTVLGR